LGLAAVWHISACAGVAEDRATSLRSGTTRGGLKAAGISYGQMFGGELALLHAPKHSSIATIWRVDV